MPKGQYTRKPRTIVETEALAERTATENQAVAHGVDEQMQRANDAEMDRIASLLISDPQAILKAEIDHRIAAGEVEAALANTAFGRALASGSLLPVAPTTKADPPSFDDWMEETPSPLPANDRVSILVQEWAAGIVKGNHSATWLPENGNRDIGVTLITDHGTTFLKANAGEWRESDIEAALEQMATDLRL